MHALLLNGSPRPGGATATLLGALAEGLRQGGTTTEAIDLRRLDLQACIGCYNCWVRTPGRCVFRDSMDALLPRLAEADLLVFGTPLYHFGMTGLMKTFFDRTLPLAEPWLEQGPDGLTRHPHRHQRDRAQMAMLVSPCGFPERSHFDALVATFRLMAQRHGWDWRGELLRPAAEPLAQQSIRPMLAPYLALVSRAGAALASTGHIPPTLEQALTQDLLPGGPEAFRAAGNRHWTRLMDRWRAPHPDHEPPPLRLEDLDLEAAQ